MVIRQRPDGTRGQERAAVYVLQPRPCDISPYINLSPSACYVRFDRVPSRPAQGDYRGLRFPPFPTKRHYAQTLAVRKLGSQST